MAADECIELLQILDQLNEIAGELVQLGLAQEQS
jgi:hypothetical protein